MTSVPPLPAFSGYQIRCYNMIKNLAKRHDVHLLSFIRTKEQWEGLERMKEICASANGVRGGHTTAARAFLNLVSADPYHVMTHRSAAMERAIKQALEKQKIDVFFSNIIYFANYLPLLPRHVYTVLDQHDLDRDVWLKQAQHHNSPLMRWYSGLNATKTMRYEEAVYPLYDLVLSVSQHDLDGAKAFAPSCDYLLAPNGVDTAYFTPGPAEAVEPNSILFTGGGADRNIQATRYFYQEVFPHVRREIPEARFYVAGNIPREKLSFCSGDPGVVLTGKVDDMRPYFHRAAVFVSPFKLGGGTKLKAIEAMSTGKAIVSTPVGVQGIDLVPDAEVLLGDTPEALAAQTVRALRDPSLCRRLGERGRAKAVSAYDWSAIVAQVEARLVERAPLKTELAG